MEHLLDHFMEVFLYSVKTQDKLKEMKCISAIAISPAGISVVMSSPDQFKRLAELLKAEVEQAEDRKHFKLGNVEVILP